MKPLRLPILILALALFAAEPLRACTPQKICGGEEAGYEVWCCGDQCNVYTYEPGKKNGRLAIKNVNPDSYC